MAPHAGFPHGSRTHRPYSGPGRFRRKARSTPCGSPGQRFQISHQNRAAPAHRLRRGKRHPPAMRPVLPQCRPALRWPPAQWGCQTGTAPLRSRDLLPAPSCRYMLQTHPPPSRPPRAAGSRIRGHCRWRPARTPGAVRATAIRCRSPSAMPGQPPQWRKASQSFCPLRPGCRRPGSPPGGRRGGSARLRPACGLPVLPQQRWRHPAPHGPPGWRTSSVHPAWRASLRHRRIQCRCR